MDVWGNGKGTTLLAGIGVILILVSYAVGVSNSKLYVFVTPFAILGALFLGVAIAILLTWLIFTDRKLDDLFVAK